jgi:hypothetical protein
MRAGMSVRKASMSTPVVSANPIDLMIGSSGRMNPAKTLIMIKPGGGDDACGLTEPVAECGVGVRAVGVGFAHAGHEEDLVVHGEPEDDADGDDGNETVDRRGLANPRAGWHLTPSWNTATVAPSAPRDRQQEAGPGGERYQERPTRDGQPQEREAGDDC